MKNTFIELQSWESIGYIVTISLFFAYIKLKKNNIILNIIFNLLVSGIYYEITNNMITVILFIILLNISKVFWNINEKELVEMEKIINLDDKSILFTGNTKSTIKKYYKEYDKNKKWSLNLLLIGLVISSTIVINTVGKFRVINNGKFILGIVIGIIIMSISIYLGLKSEKIYNMILKKIDDYNMENKVI